MDSCAAPDTHVALRLPSGQHKILELKPDTTISLGKYGAIPANDLLGRPFYQTYEVLDQPTPDTSSLRLIPPSELHAETLAEDAATPSESRDDASPTPEQLNEAVAARNNQLTVDDPTRQSLSMEEIEELKASGSGRDIIARIMASHSHLGEKTAFSLAKYTLRKQRKYMKRFTLLPLDVTLLAQWYLHEKEPPKIMELRQETIGLIMSWANVHCGTTPSHHKTSGRWLVVDETAGLLVAAMAERMGILYPPDKDHGSNRDDEITQDVATNGDDPTTPPTKRRRPPEEVDIASSNTITLIHPATQPNLSMLSYFNFDPNNTAESPESTHPLHTHLKMLTWLQLLDPTSDITYHEPDPIPKPQLEKMKSGKRGAYYRKRRRWAHCKAVVDETRAGGFDGLIVATSMDLPGVLQHLVPLLRGGAPVAIYSPNAEPPAEITDYYSSGRKTAYLNAIDAGEDSQVPSDDFLVDPRLLLAPSLQTARARDWQVLPGRTHPVMTAKGGAEGFVLTGTRVLPAEGKVEARGKFTKKRKTDGEQTINGLNGENVEKTESR